MSKPSRNSRKSGRNRTAKKSSNLPQKLAPEEEEIFRELQERVPALQNFPPADKLALIRSVSIKMHSGPLPSPEDLSRYAALIPDGAERIMALTEKQANHRMEMERKVIQTTPLETRRGQIFAFLIGISGLGTAAYIAHLGMAVAAGTIATAALGTLAVGFLKARSS